MYPENIELRNFKDKDERDEGEDLKYEVYKIEEAIMAAGGFGKFQWIFCTITTLLFVPIALMVYIQSFFTLKQVMQCPNSAGDLVLCDEAGINPCDGSNLIPGVVPDFNNEKSLKNWITELDLFCIAPFKVSLFGALYFAGLIVGMILLIYTSKFGRKINVVIFTWATVFVMTSIVFIPNLYVRYIGMFMLGICTIQKFCTYIICVEICPLKQQIVVATVILALDNIPLPLGSFYFRFISNDWRYFGYGSVIFTLILAVCSLFLPESPRFLVDKGEFEQAKIVVDRISRINKSGLYQKHWKFNGKSQNNSQDSAKELVDNDEAREKLLNYGKEKGDLILKKNPLRQMRKQPKLALNLAISTICWTACSFNYFLLSYDTKNLGGNIFLNTSLIAFSNVGGKLITLGVRNYASTKISMMVCMTICFIFGFGLIFFKEGWIIALCITFILIGIGGGFTLSYYLNNEYFPPLFVSFAFSVTQFGSRGLTILSYLMSDLQEPIPMILLCTTTGIALFCLVFLTKPPMAQSKSQ
ncbi:unnamed protein product [Moneuplotes crassus]|uniref:Uncharacterized protein n=1 Tax=Euplotes crassus TaxID=5936 RepID=A0AAD1UCG6_EUPCR|nr:unnamed protein product [Moneuplotes crassus]